MHLTWRYGKDTDKRGRTVASETGVDFDGSVDDWVALCDLMPGFAESAMVRSVEKVCMAAGTTKAPPDDGA